MSQTNNEIANEEWTMSFEQDTVTPITDTDKESNPDNEWESQWLTRHSFYKDPNAPRILYKDFDLYICQCPIDKNKIIIKSRITEQIIPNRRYNKKSGYIEKIDLTLEEEDRRLLITAKDPKAVLGEDYYKSLGYGWA